MCNFAIIPESVVPDAEIGDQVDVKVRGTLVEEDGQRKIEITHVDGKPVESMEEYGKPHHRMELPDSEDALMTFIKVIKPKNK